MSVPFIRAEYLFGFGTEQQKFDCKPAFERIKPLKSEFWKKGLIIASGLNLLALIASVFTYPEISADSRAKRAISRQVIKRASMTLFVIGLITSSTCVAFSTIVAKKMSGYEIILLTISGIASVVAVTVAAIVAAISGKATKMKSSLQVELKSKEPPEANPTASWRALSRGEGNESCCLSLPAALTSSHSPPAGN